MPSFESSPAPGGRRIVMATLGLNLALFSKVLADTQPDWPPRTVITGFPISARANGAGLPAGLVRFLDDGPPPIVFTLGTALGSDAGRFYEISLASARALGCRAVLVGSDAPRVLAAASHAMTFGYAPYSEGLRLHMEQ